MTDDKCYFCNETRCLERHHIVPRRFNGSDNDENLVTVCPTCHRKLESLYDKKFYDDLDISADDSPDYGVFSCMSCGDEFIRPLRGNIPDCPTCGVESTSKNPNALLKYEVENRFKDFARIEKDQDIEPENNFIVWYKYVNKGYNLYPLNNSTPVKFDNKVDANQKALSLIRNESIENAGVLIITSISKTDFLEEIAKGGKSGDSIDD